MMNKENILFGIIGLLLGLIVGFMFANSVNQQAMMTAAVAGGGAVKQNSSLPPGHPEVPGGATSEQAAATSMPEVQAAVDKAKQNPNDFDAQIKAAEVYYQIGRYEGAIEYLRRANQIKPDHYETIVNLGNSYFDSSDYAEAEKWYTAALAKKTDDVNARTDLGLTFIFRDPPNYDRAIQEFQRSLAVNPTHVQTLQNLTVAYTKKGDAAQAKQTLARLETADATNSAIPKLRDEIGKLEVR
jgi:tetratricopeptide (TPR) repeat protein